MTMRAPITVLALLCAGAIYPWIDTGHMVVAEIAESRLTPRAKSLAAQLLNIGGTPRTSTFVTAACWADDTKTRANGPWHYINQHFRDDGKPTTNQPLHENVVWAIERFRSVLADAKQPAADRADALRFLLHFVGDVHQPLHTVARDSDAHPEGDRGGNLFPVRRPPGWTEEPRQLHLLWDFGCGEFMPVNRPLDPQGQRKVREQAAAIMREFPPAKFAELRQMDPMQWAKEGLTLAKAYVYTMQPGDVPSEAYLRQGARLCRKRAALAGYRLAALLNAALK